MASNAKFHPLKLSMKHRMIAYLTAMGKGPTEISKEIQMTPSRITAIKGSPLFRELVKKLQDEHIEMSKATLSDRLLGFAPDAIDALGELSKLADTDSVRVSASKGILEYLIPKKQQIQIDETKKIVFEGEGLRIMAQAMAEGEGRKAPILEAEAHEVSEESPIDEATRIVPESIEEFCENYQ